MLVEAPTVMPIALDDVAPPIRSSRSSMSSFVGEDSGDEGNNKSSKKRNERKKKERDGFQETATT